MLLSFVLTVAVLGLVVVWAESRLHKHKPVCQEIDNRIASLQASRSSAPRSVERRN